MIFRAHKSPTSIAARPLARRLAKMEAAFLRQHRPLILTALVAMLLQSLALLPLPYLQGWVIDRLLARGKPASTTVPLGSLLVAAALLPLVCLLTRLALAWLSSGIMNRVSLEFVRALPDSLHRKLQP